MPRRRGGNRTVLQLSDENYLALQTSVTPNPLEKPDHGALSRLANAIFDDWRARTALKPQGEQQ